MERQVASLNNQAVRAGGLARGLYVPTRSTVGWPPGSGDAGIFLPRGLHDPRVAIRPAGITIACRAEWGRLDSVVSLDLDAYTDTAGILTLRFARSAPAPCPGRRKTCSAALPTPAAAGPPPGLGAGRRRSGGRHQARPHRRQTRQAHPGRADRLEEGRFTFPASRGGKGLGIRD